MQLNPRSENNLRTCHPDLIRVVRRAVELVNAKSSDPAWRSVGFIVTEGVRTPARQREMVRKGLSKTLNSRHLAGKDGLSRAFDFVGTLNGAARWDWPFFHKLAPLIKQAAREIGIPIVWGGDWKSFKDGPHFELPRSKYP